MQFVMSSQSPTRVDMGVRTYSFVSEIPPLHRRGPLSVFRRVDLEFGSRGLEISVVTQPTNPLRGLPICHFPDCAFILVDSNLFRPLTPPVLCRPSSVPSLVKVSRPWTPVYPSSYRSGIPPRRPSGLVHDDGSLPSSLEESNVPCRLSWVVWTYDPTGLKSRMGSDFTNDAIPWKVEFWSFRGRFGPTQLVGSILRSGQWRIDTFGTRLMEGWRLGLVVISSPLLHWDRPTSTLNSLFFEIVLVDREPSVSYVPSVIIMMLQ